MSEIKPLILTPNLESTYSSLQLKQFNSTLVPLLNDVKLEDRFNFIKNYMIGRLYDNLGCIRICNFDIMKSMIYDLNIDYLDPHLYSKKTSSKSYPSVFDTFSFYRSAGVDEKDDVFYIIGTVDEFVFSLGVSKSGCTRIDFRDLSGKNEPNTINGSAEWDAAYSNVYDTYTKAVVPLRRSVVSLSNRIECSRIKRELSDARFNKEELDGINQFFSNPFNLCSNIADSGEYVFSYLYDLAKSLSMLKTVYGLKREGTKITLVELW